MTDPSNKAATADNSIIKVDELDADGVAAATILTWKLDANLFLKLMYANNHKFGQTLVLFELVRFHQENGFDKWCMRSADELMAMYPKGATNNSVIRYAIYDLIAMRIIEINPTVRNTKRQFKLRPVELLEMVSEVNPAMPGLSD